MYCRKGKFTLNGKNHDRWYIMDTDESNDTWLIGDRNDEPQES
jgi:hypothetical protein